MSSRKGGRWSPSSSFSKSKSSKLSTGSFKGRFSSHYGTSKSGSTTSSEAGETSATVGHGGVDGALASSAASFAKPVISLTSSTGSSSCILSSQDEDSTSDHSSRSSSGLNRIASRASDIQTYASRYLDSIRSKSWTAKSRNSPSRSDSPTSSSSTHHSGIPYLLTFRQHQQHPSVQAAIASNLQPLLRTHSSTPSPPPSSSSSLPSRKTSDSRSVRNKKKLVGDAAGPVGSSPHNIFK